MSHLRKNTRFRITTMAARLANQRLRNDLMGGDNELTAIVKAMPLFQSAIMRARWAPLVPYWFKDLSLKIRDADVWLIRPKHHGRVTKVVVDATQEAIMHHKQKAMEDILRSYFKGRKYE